MEFDFYISSTLTADPEGVTLLKGKDLPSYIPIFNSRKTRSRFTDFSSPKQESESQSKYSKLREIIDRMGAASSKAQRLPHIITTYMKFKDTEQRLYIKFKGKKVEGILKVGKRKLFHYDHFGSCKEINPLCVLDFYVHESMQRQGIGKVSILFVFIAIRNFFALCSSMKILNPIKSPMISRARN